VTIAAEVSTAGAILAWIGLALGLVIALVVVKLFNNVTRPALEVQAYADDILDAGLGIAKNLDGVTELERTDQLTSAVPGLAVAYLEQAKGSGP
jgi:hypothetical protein